MRCAACWRWSVTRPSVSSPTSDTVIVIGTALMPVIKELTLRPWVHCKFMALIWAIRAVCTPWDIVSDTCFHVMLCFIQQGLAHTLHLFSHVCGRISWNRKLARIIRETDKGYLPFYIVYVLISALSRLTKWWLQWIWATVSCKNCLLNNL